jgi:hypothetical protein
VVDGIERDDAGGCPLTFPLPGEGDVLRRVDGQHFAFDLGIAQSEANSAANASIDVGVVEPLAQAG